MNAYRQTMSTMARILSSPKSGAFQCLDVARHHRIRLNGELSGVVQHHPSFHVQVYHSIVVNNVAGVLGVAGVLTEEPSGSDSSVATFVDNGNGGRYRLFL